jgi:hypothetical protein
MDVEFVETAVFSRRIEALRLEGDLRSLQLELLANPDAGRLDPGTGGLRKIRMTAQSRGKGKRGGARVHYLPLTPIRRIYLIFVYGKDEIDTLSPVQKRALRAVVEGIKEEAIARRRSERGKASD